MTTMLPEFIAPPLADRTLSDDEHPNEDLVRDLIPVASELVATIRDYGPADVENILARVPDGRHDALAVVLAAMVDPDATARDLLAWTEKPVQSRDRYSHPLPREHGSERGYRQHQKGGDMPACDDCLAAHNEANRAYRENTRKRLRVAS